MKRMKKCQEAEEVHNCAQALVDLSASNSTVLLKEEEVSTFSTTASTRESSTVSCSSPIMLNLMFSCQPIRNIFQLQTS